MNNEHTPSENASTDRPCATCAHRTEAMVGAPSVCALFGAMRKVEINRAQQGLCGVRGRMWKQR